MILFRLKKLIGMRNIFFTVVALIALFSLFKVNTFAAPSSERCNCDHDEQFLGTGLCPIIIPSNACDSSHPYCIEQICHDTKLPDNSPQKCGENEDCISGICDSNTDRCQARLNPPKEGPEPPKQQEGPEKPKEGPEKPKEGPEKPKEGPIINACTEYRTKSSNTILYGECRTSCGSNKELAQYSSACAKDSLALGSKCCEMKVLSDPEPNIPRISCDGKCSESRPSTDSTCPNGYTYNDIDPQRIAKDSTCGGGSNYCWTCASASKQSFPMGPDEGPCSKEKGGVKSYVNSFCDKKPYSLADAEAGVFCKAVYSDKYICNNTDSTGKNIEDYYEAPGVTACASSPWCPSNAGAVCKSANGTTQDCRALFGSNYSCTNDFTNGMSTQTTHCCPDNKRWCPTASSCVSESQGCGGLLANIGGVCGDTSQCADKALGAQCLKLQNTAFNTCQWPGGVGPTSTPGAPSNESCAQSLAAGRAPIGCPCPAGGGCVNNGCYHAAGGNIVTGPFYCSNGPGTWCEQSKTSVANANACLGASPFVPPSPTPKDLGYQADCPTNNPVSGLPNTCSDPGLNKCPDGFTQNTTLARPGGTNGNQVCESVKGTGSRCCTTSTSVAATTTAPTLAPSTSSAPTNAPATPAKTVIPYVEEACDYNADPSHYVKGTYCDGSAKYDVYCGTNNRTYKSPTGAAC